MNVTQEPNGDLNAIIHINLVEADYLQSVNKQLADYRKKASMPGFRPGKVPMGMIKKMYGKSVLAEEVNKTVSEALNNYIIENKLKVLGYPLPNLEKSATVDLEKNDSHDFYFDVGLSPEFEIPLSDKITIPYYKIKVKDADIDKAINDVKIRFGTEENPEKAEESDGVQGKFSELDAEGNIVDGGVEHDGFFKIEDIKENAIQKHFIDAGAGTSVDFNLMKAFEDESKVESLLHLHDKPQDKMNADYRFVIDKVVRSHEAEINEELFKKVYPNDDLKTKEEFRNRIAEELSKHYSGDSDRQMLADGINELIKLADISLPDEFMKRWLVESNEGKITKEQVEEQYESYGKTIRWQLIESKLQEEFGNDVIVSDEEVRDKVRQYFMGAGGQVESNPQIEGIVDNILKNPEERQRIYSGIMDEKFIKLLKEKIKLKEKEVDSDKFFEIASNTK